MLQAGIRKYFPVKRAGDDGHTSLPLIGKRNRSGSQELPGNTGNETTLSENTSYYSDETSSCGPQPQRPLAKRIKAEIELLSTERPTSSPYVGEVSSDASQRTYLPTPQIHPNLETSSTAEHSESLPMSSLSVVDEASSSPSQLTNPPTIQMSVNIESSSSTADHFEAAPTSLYVDDASLGATSSTAEHGEAFPISSVSIDEASSGAPQSTNSPTMQMNADADPPSTGGPAETHPVSRKRSRSPSPSEGQPFPGNIRKFLAPPLPPTKRARFQSGEAVPTQSPAYGETPPNSDSQTRYGVPARRQKHRVPKEMLMLLIRKSRHSASETMLETQNVSESFLSPDDSISRHINSAGQDNANRASTPLPDQASGGDHSPPILAPGMNDSVSPLRLSGPPSPVPSGIAASEVAPVGPRGVPAEITVPATNAAFPAAALPSMSVNPPALHTDLMTGVAHPAATMDDSHPHPASVFRGSSSLVSGLPPPAQDVRAAASPAQPSAHPISSPPSTVVPSMQTPAAAAAAVMMDSVLMPSPSRTADSALVPPNIQASRIPPLARLTTIDSSTITAQDIPTATSPAQLSQHSTSLRPSAVSSSLPGPTAVMNYAPPSTPSRASGPSLAPSDIHALYSAPVTLLSTDSMPSATHLTTAGPSANTAQDARVAALPSQPSVGPALLPASTVVSSIQGPTISAMMYSTPVPSSSRAASPLSAASNIQAPQSVLPSPSPLRSVSASAHLTTPVRLTGLVPITTPTQPLPLHSALARPSDKGKSVIKPSVRFQTSSDSLESTNTASGSTHSSDDHVDGRHHLADDDINMADLTQDGDEGTAGPSAIRGIDAPNMGQRRGDFVEKLDMLQTYEYLKNNPDVACTNKSIAAIFEAFVGMKEDIKSALHPEPAVAVPARQYKRRGKKPIRETFDVEHHDEEDLDLLRDVRMFAKELLKLPEEPLKVPTVDELKAFAKKVEGAVGPQRDPFVLDLASKGTSSPWNLSAISMFADEFVKSLQYPCSDKERISIAFKTHLATLKKHYSDQEDAAAMDDRTRIEELDKSKRSAHYQRRSNKRHRRRDSLRAYQHVDGAPLLTSKLQRIPVDAMSEEEVEHDGENTYWVASDCAWRSSEMKNLWDILDALDLSMHFQTNERPTRGRFPYHRVASNRVGALPAPSRLPANLYSEEYKAGLSAAQLAALNMQPSFKFVFPVELLRGPGLQVLVERGLAYDPEDRDSKVEAVEQLIQGQMRNDAGKI
ncbi:hypothetical protein HYPSUDRAFT_201794 [Hypholoma sublateritium FD-334 SS-4]|uniref:Uncharacterized protein n=1 Tax=Hypholoma sublateritium (strain FD-334 SS-4) TaxID=945553 RepID=A0A0D2L7A6_HYPSF|nr:hypothetical protein HYPSUDRAFT_201794 [Hypholoma sublateritium FD-334 SS-4]